MTRVAILQTNTGIDPSANCEMLTSAVAEASADGAQMLFTPEMCGLLDRNRDRASQHICVEADDPVLAGVREAARRYNIWVSLGSLAVKGQDDRWANRSFVIDNQGDIVARYDKLHMFDVELASGENWTESAAYQRGNEVVVVETPAGRLGLAICYDIRFPALFDRLGSLECDVIAIPAAFTRPTGRDHWHILQRARAIEASAYVVAAAQVGEHEDGRETYGHSLVVDPWGEVLLDMGGQEPGLDFADIDRERIQSTRRQVPSLANRRKIAD